MNPISPIELSNDNFITLSYANSDIKSVECSIKENYTFIPNQKIGSYKLKDDKVLFITAPFYGKLVKFNKEERTIIIEECKHEMFYYDLCTQCSYDKSKNPSGNTNEARYSSLHPTLTFSYSRAKKEEQNIVDVYLKEKKLILLLDLDNTILHTCGFDISKEDITFLKEKYGDYIGLVGVKREFDPKRYDNIVIKFRPHLKEFFEVLNDRYQIYTYTHGTKEYALGIIRYVNQVFCPDCLSEERLIAREKGIIESKTIKKVFPTTEDMVLILDDRSSVWQENDDNLINLQPYGFFSDENLVKIKDKFLQVDYDNVLYSITKILTYVHTSFYNYYTENATRKSVKTIMKEKLHNIFNDQTFLSSGIFGKDIDVKNTTTYAQINKFGGELLQTISDKEEIDCLLMAEYKKTYKLNIFEKAEKPILHGSYVDICHMFFVKLSYDEFILSKDKTRLETLDVVKLFMNNKHLIDSFYSNTTQTHEVEDKNPQISQVTNSFDNIEDKLT